MVTMTTVTMMHSSIRRSNSSGQHDKCDGTKNQIANLHRYFLSLRYFIFRNSQLVNEAYSLNCLTSNVPA